MEYSTQSAYSGCYEGYVVPFTSPAKRRIKALMTPEHIGFFLEFCIKILSNYLVGLALIKMYVLAGTVKRRPTIYQKN
ncbi:MAG: hypothetical protein MHPSP_004145, partial [Paramarteilia canceri]